VRGALGLRLAFRAQLFRLLGEVRGRRGVDVGEEFLGVCFGVGVEAGAEPGGELLGALALRVDRLLVEDAEREQFALQEPHGVVRAPRLSVDEAVRWMVSDQRAIRGIGRDHEWLRILDVPRVLSARRYDAPGSAVIAVADPLGYAEGTWRLDVDPDGTAVVEPVDAAADLALSVADLGSILLGGVRPSTLRAAGRIAGDADAAEAATRTHLAGIVEVLRTLD